MKRIIAGLFAVMLIIPSAFAVDLYIDTNKIETDTPPAIVDGRTLVPFRAIFEALGAEVSWDKETHTATGTRDGIVIEIPIGSTTAYVNGEAKELDVPAQIINDRTMVPARFISETLNCKVTWDGHTKTAAVADKLRDYQIYVTPTGQRYHFDEHCNGGTYKLSTLAEAMGRGLTPCNKCVVPVLNSNGQ